jgi:hypothetical protein
MSRLGERRIVTPLKCGCSVYNTGIAWAGMICTKCGVALQPGLPTLAEYQERQRTISAAQEAEAEDRLP